MFKRKFYPSIESIVKSKHFARFRGCPAPAGDIAAKLLLLWLLSLRRLLLLLLLRLPLLFPLSLLLIMLSLLLVLLSRTLVALPRRATTATGRGMGGGSGGKGGVCVVVSVMSQSSAVGNALAPGATTAVAAAREAAAGDAWSSTVAGASAAAEKTGAGGADGAAGVVFTMALSAEAAAAAGLLVWLLLRYPYNEKRSGKACRWRSIQASTAAVPGAIASMPNAAVVGTLVSRLRPSAAPPVVLGGKPLHCGCGPPCLAWPADRQWWSCGTVSLLLLLKLLKLLL